jgi:predicted phage replisome organizer
MATKKYYWLKLNLDFFEREEIRIIEDMPNGKEYCYFYMKLLVKSANSDGLLVFRGVVPYTLEMLASLTNTNIDIVRSAVKLFLNLGMMQRLEDKTLYLHEVQNMLGCETEYARKKREYREKKKLEVLGYNEDIIKITEDDEQDNIETAEDIQMDKTKTIEDIATDKEKTKKDNVRQEIEYRDKSIEIDIEREEKKDFFSRLSKMEYVEKLEKLKKLIMKVTEKDENSVNLVFRPSYYTDIIDDLLIAIKKSKYLRGEITNRKPNLNTYTVKDQIDRILAGVYEDYQQPKLQNEKATISSLKHQGVTADDLLKEINM